MANAEAAPASEYRFRLGHWLLVAVCCYFIALKLIFSFSAFPIADEAYYWMWGRHPQLSYFDHPPLQGWLQGLSYHLFGRSLFALRWMSVALFAATVWIFWLVARRIGGSNPRGIFWRTVLVYLASPLFGFFGSVVFNDYLLVFLLIASGYLFFCYFADVETTGRGRLRDLFGAAVLLGLAGLTKYNGAYLGLAVAGAVFTRPKLRPLLRHWPLYTAGAITVLMQCPVLIWNMQQNFASFRFHLVERNASGFTGLNPNGMLAVALDQTGMLSPFMIPVIVGLFVRRSASPFEGVGKTIAIWAFWLSSLTFLYIANYSWVLWWWNIAAFVLVLPFAGKHINRILLALHAVWGLLLNTVLVLSFTIAPVTTAAGLPQIMEADTVFGWEAIVAAVREAEAQYRPDFLATNRYQSASQLGFALDDPDVTAISKRPDQFDYWFDSSAHQGQNAVLLVDNTDDTESYRLAFETVTKIRDIDIERFGRPVKHYQLYFGEGYRGP